MAWYTIDNQFYRNGGRFKPDYITEQDLKNHYIRPVIAQGDLSQPAALPGRILLNRSLMWPTIPRNAVHTTTTPGLMQTAFCTQPETNWGAIMTPIQTEVDFDKGKHRIHRNSGCSIRSSTRHTAACRTVPSTRSNTTGGKLVFQSRKYFRRCGPRWKACFRKWFTCQP